MNFPLVTNIKLRTNIWNKFLDDLANNKFKDAARFTFMLGFEPE